MERSAEKPQRTKEQAARGLRKLSRSVARALACPKSPPHPSLFPFPGPSLALALDPYSLQLCPPNSFQRRSASPSVACSSILLLQGLAGRTRSLAQLSSGAFSSGRLPL